MLSGQHPPERAQRGWGNPSRRPGWVAAAGIALTSAIGFGFLFFRQIALGEAPFLAWAVAASAWFPLAAVIAFWTLAGARGARLPGWGARIALTAAMFLGTAGCLMFAFWLFASGRGGFR